MATGDPILKGNIRLGKDQLEFTTDKLLKGAGTGNDPIEIDVPVGATVVRKTADETVNNSNTLQNDDHLLFAIAANEEWVFEIVLFMTACTGTADVNCAITVPTGASVKYGHPDVRWAQDNTPEMGQQATASGTALSSEGAAHNLIIYGWVKNGANAGNVQVQWAQSTAEASDLTMGQGSYLVAHKVA